jgi:cytochrome b
MMMTDENLRVYDVWDRPTRWFHWINVMAILGLVGFGLVILNAGALGISTEGKILLKENHVLVGYVFVCNLIVRLIWGFFGNQHARWRGLLRYGLGYITSVRDYIKSFAGGNPQTYRGHNPLGRAGVTILFVLLIVQAITGLVLAGTDIFYPPLGGWIAEWIAAEGVDPGSLVPYAKETYNEQAYQEMRAFRKPFITTHLYSFYVLLVMIVLHITAVVVTEIRERGTLISAMFTGRKTIAGTPQDYCGDAARRS